MHPADDHAHRLVAAVRADDVFVVRCACGWLTRAGTTDDALAFHERHRTHVRA
ncbi:MAG: hypothetical protein QOD30_389 [Actinomycetota bacterium]|nr:hypothetical protein [Actinomycetota bacterium]